MPEVRQDEVPVLSARRGWPPRDRSCGRQDVRPSVKQGKHSKSRLRPHWTWARYEATNGRLSTSSVSDDAKGGWGQTRLARRVATPSTTDSLHGSGIRAECSRSRGPRADGPRAPTTDGSARHRALAECGGNVLPRSPTRIQRGTFSWISPHRDRPPHRRVRQS
jgi:hypothetical protein